MTSEVTMEESAALAVNLNKRRDRFCLALNIIGASVPFTRVSV